MNLNSLSPYVRYASRSYLRAPFKIGPRIIFDYELIFVESGKFLLEVEGQKWIAKKGDVLFFRPGIRHCLQSIDSIPVSQPHIHFDLNYDQFSESAYISFKDLPDFTAEEREWIRQDLFAQNPIGPVLSISDIDEFQTLLHKIIAAYYDKGNLYQLELKSNMLLLLKRVIRDNISTLETKDTATVVPETIKQFIDYNYKMVISLDTLEEQFHYSRYHISRAFSAYTGNSVIKYYNQKRITYAKEMLLEGASVTSVANDLSFNSIYSFSRFFKNAVGCSPRDYLRATHHK